MTPEARFLARLFGDLTTLSGEELDLLYQSVAAEEDPEDTVGRLASQTVSRYRARNRTVPRHVQAYRSTHNLPARVDGVQAPVRGNAAESTKMPTPGLLGELAPLNPRTSTVEADRKIVDELAAELAETQEEEHYASPAAQLASLLLDRFKISGKPDLDILCCLLGLRVREKALDGFDGVLVRRQNAPEGIIGINAAIREISRRRFTIAHEIGHFIIPYHQRPETMCETGLIESFSRKLATPELEANEFATELLLPRKAMRKRLDLDCPSLARISQVANEFETSLSAAALRFLSLTKQPCGMVWSIGGKSVWYRTSENLPLELPLQALPARGSVASRLFAGESHPVGMQEIDARSWFHPIQANHIRTVFEDSIYFPGHNAVCSLLWIARQS